MAPNHGTEAEKLKRL